jgi:hypothetical protein
MTKCFQKVFEQVTSNLTDFCNYSVRITEDADGGGADSSFGPGVDSTATSFSGDNYAQGDNRIPYGVYGGGVLTRRGLKKTKKTSKKRKKKKTK